MIECKEIDEFVKNQLKIDMPEFQIGDTIDVHTRIVEGEKERIQVFTGTVIARKGSGISESVVLYRVSYGSGIQRVFPVHSRSIAKIVVVKRGKARKAKLYYLLGRFGKKAKIPGRIDISSKVANNLEKVRVEETLEPNSES